jgi:AcrR family transcriptional regulator
VATTGVPKRPRPGRPAGSPANREAILAAAEGEFAARGYEGATIRGIARRAGVDPALVYHYFGSKERLFSEVIRIPLSPPEFALRILDGEVETIGERLVRSVLELWKANPASLAGLLRSTTSHEEAPRPREVLEAITTALQVPQSRLRAALVSSQIIGLALARSVIEIEPLATASEDQLVAYYGPTVQRHLTGPLPGD